MQVKVWLLGINPMVWRRLLVPDTCALRELHGVIQVAMERAIRIRADAVDKRPIGTAPEI